MTDWPDSLAWPSLRSTRGTRFDLETNPSDLPADAFFVVLMYSVSLVFRGRKREVAFERSSFLQRTP